MKDILKTIENSDTALLLTHHNADIDAIASSIALYEILQDIEVDMGVSESISKGAKDLASNYNFTVNPSIEGYDMVVFLDTPSKEQLEPVNIEKQGPKKILVDHHTSGEMDEFVDESFVYPDSTSTAEIIYRSARDLNRQINEGAATALISGIVADTSHLKHASSREFRYISELLDQTEKEYSDILSILSTPVDFSERVARIKACKRIEAHRLGEKIVVFSKVGSFEAASARAFLRMGADIAIVACPRDGELRISGRCKRELTDKIHLAEDVFKPLEQTIQGSAGGHDAAASSNGKNTDEEEIFKDMLERLEYVLSESSNRL